MSSESAEAKKTPYVTYAVIGLCVLVYLWELMNYARSKAALVGPIAIMVSPELWTMFTMTLVHSHYQANPHHLQLNGVLSAGPTD